MSVDVERFRLSWPGELMEGESTGVFGNTVLSLRRSQDSSS